MAARSIPEWRKLAMRTLPRLLALLLTLGIAVALPTASAPVKPLAAQKPSPASQLTAQRSAVTFKDGKLSVNSQNQPLELLADEITQKAGVAVILAEGLGQHPISSNFEGLSLDEGLHRILKDHDAFFFYGVKKEGAATLNAVWVYPKGRGRNLAPVPPEKWASTQELEKMLADSNPEARLQAILALIERKGSKAQDVVLKGLKDQDDKVRYRTLDQAAKAGVGLPAEVLENLVQNDSSEIVRFLALDAMAERPGADTESLRAIAENALNDPSEHVRNQAREILDRMDATSAPPETSGSSKNDEQEQGNPEPPKQ